MGEEEWTNAHYSKERNLALLSWHCLKKGVQLGSVVGNAVVMPISIFRQYKYKGKISFEKLLSRIKYSMLTGTTFSMLILTGKYQGWQNKALCLQDRVYRIHKNAGQTRADMFTGIGFASVFALSYAFTGSVMRSFSFGSFGITMGLIAHIETKSNIPKE